MQEANVDPLIAPAPASRDVLSEILRAGAQRLLTQAIEARCANMTEALACRFITVEGHEGISHGKDTE